MFWGAIVLFGITLAGIFISCKVFGYEISALRKVVAAGVFVVLNVIRIPIPIPILGAIASLLIPALGLYVSLMDETYQRSEVNKVFGLTYAIAIAAVLAIYLPLRS
jgi:hypothetical protein